MLYGFSLPARGPLAAPEPLRQMTLKGEALGYTYLTVPDHIVIPNSIAANYPYSDDGSFAADAAGMSLEQLTQIAFLAGITSKVKFLTSVMVVPHRMPVHNAKTISTIDYLSGGRMIVGVGAGWMEEEFVAVGTPPFKERGKVTDEYIAAMKTLWTEENPSFSGDYVSFENIRFAPKPVQKPHPPIWVGGESGPALRRVVRHGDAWFPIGRNPKFPMGTAARLGAGWSRVKQLAEEAGRDPGSIELGYWTGTVSAGAEELDDEGNRRLLTGSTGQIVDDIGAMRDLGVKHVLLNHQRASVNETLEAIEQFMTDVASKVS